MALLRAELLQMAAAVDRLVFVYASEQLVAPLLCRLLAQNNTPKFTRFGSVRLADILSRDCVAPTVVELLTAEWGGAAAASLTSSNCAASSSRVLYQLIHHSLGGEELSYANFIQPFCRPLDLAATAEAAASQPPASHDIRIFLSHLPVGVPAFEIRVSSGAVVDRSGSATSLLEITCISSSEDEDATQQSTKQGSCHSLAVITEVSLVSSDEDDVQHGQKAEHAQLGQSSEHAQLGQSSEHAQLGQSFEHAQLGPSSDHAQLKIRPVKSCQLMESNAVGDDTEQTVVAEEEEPNQVCTMFL
jgi:hypothetical protein